MKKTLSILNIICLLAILVMSCKEDEKSNVPFNNGTATLTGMAYVNTDLRNDTDEYGAPEIQYELVDAGTVIYAQASAADLVSFPSSSVSYGTITYSTQIQADGSYSFTIDANEKPVAVSLSSNDYRTEFIYSDEYSEPEIVSIGYFADTLTRGVTKILDVYFY